jgi:hypothetical protein
VNSFLIGFKVTIEGIGTEVLNRMKYRQGDSFVSRLRKKTNGFTFCDFLLA